MEDKAFGFQFKPMSAKPTQPHYKFQKLRHFHLKGNARLSLPLNENAKQSQYRNTVSLEFTEAIVCRYFSK